MSDYKMLINSELVEAESGKTIPVINPATGEEFARVAVGEIGPEAEKDIEWVRSLVAMGSWRRVFSTILGSSDIIRDIPNYVRLYKAGRLKLDELISGYSPLEKINEAIASMRTGEALRNIIVFQ
jgi:Zn-dependent alcohol dehydrogenase